MAPTLIAVLGTAILERKLARAIEQYERAGGATWDVDRYRRMLTGHVAANGGPDNCTARDGRCVCGAMVANHFGNGNRFYGCVKAQERETRS